MSSFVKVQKLDLKYPDSRAPVLSQCQPQVHGLPIEHICEVMVL